MQHVILPLLDRVLIEVAPEQNKSEGGVIIPDNAKEKPMRGTVIGVGEGKEGFPMKVKEGDTVLYAKFAGTEISVGGKDYILIRQSDIFAILQQSKIN